MSRCKIQFEELVDYQDGSASGERFLQLCQHLTTGCTFCEASLSELKKIHQVMLMPELVSAPHAVQSSARAIFREYSRSKSPLAQIAKLLFDSRSNMSPTMARGEKGAFQRLYATEEYEIDIWEERIDANHYYLIGQAMPQGGGAAILPELVEMISSDGSRCTTFFEEAEFHIPIVARGKYEIQLRIADTDIRMTDLLVD